MLKTLLQIAGALVAGLVSGTIGLLIGALFGGNFATSFVFFDLRGYEATVMVGFILFGLAGLIISWRWLNRKKARSK